MGRTEVILKDAPKDAPRPPHTMQEWIRKHAANLPKRGSKWRHYKGRVVKVLAVGVREETGRVCVMYEEESGEVWDRLLGDWSDTVHSEERIIQRFTEIV